MSHPHTLIVSELDEAISKLAVVAVRLLSNTTEAQQAGAFLLARAYHRRYVACLEAIGLLTAAKTGL